MGAAHHAADRRLVRLWWDCYTLPGLADQPAIRLNGADLCLGFPAVACLHTAAALYGFDLTEDDRIHVLAPGSASASRRVPIVLHRDRALSPLVRVDGRLATSAAETAVGLAARHRGGPQALAVLDAALRSAAVNRTALMQVAEQLGLNNIRRVRALVPLAVPAAESPAESRMRWHILQAGLPTPDVQFPVTAGGQRYRLDLAWPERKVGCEYDGVLWHTGERLSADRQRLNALQRAGWTIVFVTKDMLGTINPDFVAHLEALLSR